MRVAFISALITKLDPLFGGAIAIGVQSWPLMLLAIDVQYDDARGFATAAGVVFAAWGDALAVEERVRVVHGVAPYEPGAFYRRELPSVLPLIAELSAAHPIGTIIIDGYVDLGPAPGFGRHLATALGAGGPAIVGVAKTKFMTATQAIEIHRGASVQPLFVSAHGIDAAVAAAHVQNMHGPHRIPTLLRRVDQLARGIAVPA